MTALQKEHPPLRIAAICAMPQYQNTGMRCVNFSLRKLVEKSGLAAKIDFFTFYLTDDGRTNFDSIEYRTIVELSDVSHYDLVVIWGDFILTKRWLKEAVSKLGKVSGWDETTVWHKIYATLFPVAETSSRPPVLVFGQSLLGDSAEIFQDEAYLNGLRSLLGTALIASMRDPVSAARATSICGEPSRNHAGVDAALLLEPLGFGRSDESTLSPLLSSRVGIFFGRARTNMTMLALAAALRRHAPGLEAVWLRWLPRRLMPWPVAKMFGIRETIAPSSLEEFIRQIRLCRFVITD
jgi:hypothetical protein